MEKFDGKICPLSIDDADNAYSYMPEVSTSSSIVYGVEAFKEQVKEAFPGTIGAVGGIISKTGKKIDEYFPNGIKLFNGSVDIKIGDKVKSVGDTLVNAANRQIEIFEEEYKKKNPRLAKAQENISFDVANQGANWTSLLLAGSVGLAGKAMGALVLSGEFKERAEKYKQEHADMGGFAEEYSDSALYNAANAYIQGIEEKYLGSWAQVKAVKKGWGFVKAIGKNAIQEGFIEEPLQDATDFYFDKIDSFNEDEELKGRLKNNLRGYVVASVFGGAGGFGGALYQRSKGIDMYKDALKDTVPEEDLENVATKAYEQDAKTLKDVVVVEIENSSSLRNKRGEVYENMYNSTLKAVKDAKALGAYPELETEQDIASYAQAESEKFADWTLAEANRRKTVIEEVIDSSKISYENGKIQIGMIKDIAPYSEIVDKVEEKIEENAKTEETKEQEVKTEEQAPIGQKEQAIEQKSAFETKENSLAEMVSEAVEETKAVEELAPSEKIEDYGEKLEGAKKDLEIVKGQKQVEKKAKDKIINKVKDIGSEKEFISDWLSKQDPEFVENLARYNHRLLSMRTNKYQNELHDLFEKHGSELGIGGMQRLEILYGNQDPSKEIQERYNIVPEKEVFIEEGKHHIVKATPEYVARKLGDRGKVVFQYNKATNGGYYLWVKKGTGGWHVLESFGSKEEMEKHRDSHTREQLEDLLKEKTDVTPREKPIRKRIGEDYRKGKNVTAKDFTDAFGFRGVQFGNYENNEKRQRELNNAYDSLMDLAMILNIPSRAISLNGQLGIAFGARGSGSAAAHYEPSGKIINITRDSGAGAIGHEWFHALDNYFAGNEKFATGGYRDSMRMELRRKLVGFLSAVEMERDYQSRLALLGQYWKRKWEVGARAFELYLVNKMEEKGITNDYLAQDSSDEIPYLNKEEQSRVFPKMQEFFDTMESRETERGVELYQAETLKNDVNFAKQDRKGSIEFSGDKALITLAESADSSTLPHELAHYYLQNTFLYAKSGLATPEYMGFYNSIAKYLNITPDQENIKEWQQEKWARAYEQFRLGKAPDGMETPLSDYNQWIRKAYDKASEPMYRDENGELKVADIPYETMKTFADLLGEELTEQEHKQNQEKVRGLAKSTSQMAKQKGIETEIPTYEPRSQTEMGKKADEFIKNNKQLAIDIVKGLAPEQDGLFRQDLFAALRELALNEGDSDLLNELSRSMTVEEATELGQRIQALARGRIDPVKQMTELRDERMKKNNTTKKKIKEETEKATKEIKKEISLAAQPKEWQDFIKSLEC